MMTDKSTSPVVKNNKQGFDARAGSTEPLRLGSLCPNCGQGKLDYKGLLELECPICGYRNTGGAIGT
jgi:uncharacterized protein (DUF983 family)